MALTFVDPDTFSDPDKETQKPSVIEGATKYLENTSGQGPRGRGLKAIMSFPYEAGGKVTDLSSRAGFSPEVSAALGTGANLTLESIPMFFGGTGAKAAATMPLKEVGRDLMQSALKPTIKQLKSGDAKVAIDTMLEEGINATKGGVEAIREKIGVLNDEIATAIKESGATIQKSEVGKTLQGLLEKFKMQVNPQADIQAVKNAWLEFRNHPLLKGITDIPVELAQRLKQGTYAQLAKKYGVMGSAETEAQKGLARGLKEGIAEAVPGIAQLNAKETALIKTLGVAERRALMELNKNPLGLSLLTQNPAAWAAFMADKSALFKSLAARAVYSGAEQGSAAGGRGLVALSEIGAGVGQE